jgi:hypothetical protein
MLPPTQNEAYVGTCCGRMWFLPLGWRTVRHLPEKQIEARGHFQTSAAAARMPAWQRATQQCAASTGACCLACHACHECREVHSCNMHMELLSGSSIFSVWE